MKRKVFTPELVKMLMEPDRQPHYDADPSQRGLAHTQLVPSQGTRPGVWEGREVPAQVYWDERWAGKSAMVS